MRRDTALLGARPSRLVRAAALFGGVTLGCSVLLRGEAKQCNTDSDCEQLGFQHWTCDSSNRVCVSAAGSSGRAGAAGGPGGASFGGASLGGAGAGGRAGAGEGGAGTHAGGAGSGGTSVGGAATGGGGTPAGGSAGNATGGAGAGGAPPIPDWVPLAPSGGGARIRIRNYCKQPVFIHAVSPQSGTLMPDDVKLTTGVGVDFLTPTEWLGGDVLIYGTAARGVLLHDLSISLSQGVSFYSLQYLEGFALPAEVSGYGGSCSPVANTRICAAHESDVASCPALLKDGARCLSASAYCAIQANQASSYCHALDTAIAGCSGCPAGSTLDVYAGTGNYAAEARLAAALNRGMTAQPDATDPALYYQLSPYNSYAKWLHGLCASGIAFPHDDFGSATALYPSCTATELRITLCPAR